MVKTLEDIKQIDDIIKRFEELGVPAGTLLNLRLWRNKQEALIIRRNAKMKREGRKWRQ